MVRQRAPRGARAPPIVGARAQRAGRCSFSMSCSVAHWANSAMSCSVCG